MNAQAYFDLIKSRISKDKSYPKLLCKYICDKFDLNKGLKILDLGCGSGMHASCFTSLGYDVTGLDNIEKIHFDDFKYVNCDISKNKIPFNNNTFDVIFCKSVIEHILYPEEFLNNCMDVLKPGGKIIILTPDWQTQVEVFYDDPTHIHPYTKSSLHDVIKMNGFENVRVEVFTQIPAAWDSKFVKLLTDLTLLVPFHIFKHFRKYKTLRFSREKMLIATATK